MLANDEFEQHIEKNSTFNNLWHHYLYELQSTAPKGRRVICNRPVDNKPVYYGREFHGVLSREEANQLLSGGDSTDGKYLVRESVRNPGQYTLSLRFNNLTKNFKLFYDNINKQHYVGEKRFDTIHDLVQDGLIILYIELHAKEYVNNLGNHCKYEESPYMTINNRNPHKNNKKSKTKLKNILEVKRLSIDDLIDEKEELEDNKSSEDELNIKGFEKRHSFKVYNFMGFPYCMYCGNFLYGLLSQGVKCEDCSFIAHKRCSEKTPNDCIPDSKSVQRIFGIDITTFVKAYNIARPWIIDYTIKEIERRGLHTEGLYRVSGFLDDVNAIKDKLEADWNDAEQILRDCDDVHVITSVLKLYLRTLPIPLISFDSYPHLMESMKKSKETDRIDSIKQSIANHMAPAPYQTLKFLLNHLYNLSLNAEVNLMSVYNISTVFCPTLMRTPNIGLNKFQMDSWQQEMELVEFLINNYNKIFK